LHTRAGISFNWIFAGEHAKENSPNFAFFLFGSDANFNSNRGRWLCRPSKKRVNFRKFHANIIAIYQLMDINFAVEHVEGNGGKRRRFVIRSGGEYSNL
jgi:hypothetical protein